MTTDDEDTADVGDDLEISKITRQAAGAGTWVCGRLAGHRFDALVFPEHALDPEFELGKSRLSKLWIWQLSDGRMVFAWDRGMDIPAADEMTHALVDFLAAGLADLAYATR